jgi:CHASE2 domain-containing sensor protein
MTMKRPAFWQKDWLVGLSVAVVLLLFAGSDLMQSLERKAYDLGVRATSRTPSDRIAIIAIDDTSIANLGRWPWPREIHARMIDLLAGGQAKVIGHTVLFSEAQVDPGLDYIRKVTAWVDESGLRRGGKAAELEKLDALLAEATQNLDNDRKLADSLTKAHNVLLSLYFEPGEPQGKPDQPPPEYVQRNRLSGVKVGPDLQPDLSLGVLMPIPALGSQALALGHLNSSRDVDGAVRSEPLAMDYYGDLYPSLSLMLAARSLNLGVGDIRVLPGEGVQLGKTRITTDSSLRMQTYFYPDSQGKPAFPVDSFYDVLSGKIPAAKYRDKVVLIGASAAGVGTLQVTPVSPSMPAVVTMAHTVSSILQGHFFVSPSWAGLAQLGIFVGVALYLIFALPRLRAAMGALVTGALFVALIGAHFLLMSTQALWLPLMLPVTLLLLGHLLLTTKRFLVTEERKEKSEADSAESNRMLGLAFQGQGALDMAFEKFRKVPMDDALMELMYNLGLDFERKRQFNKAESVFRYIADYNRKFRDLETRLAQNKAMSETVILGGAARGNDSTLVLDGAGGMAKPMLGRYEVEKELGKGAMGVVYLGKDPKIGRQVAIKTMALAQEFDLDILAEVKQRFFSEAESAGRLNHPNIVTMYDAGEEHDLAYIAMEYLKGRDLVPNIKPGALLPLPTVMSIVARVAEALDYAHRQNVVHRDIKPGNIMYDPESDTVKVADFGIARLTDSNKTKTGMVLGTPSYMSPEQLAGRKVDGRSDLFSLGVTLYQLASGSLPFDGDSMAQLMYRITNEEPVDILSVRSDLPPCLVSIITRTLSKTPEQRYASGAEMAQALRDCAAGLPPKVWDATVPTPPAASGGWTDTVVGKT